MSVSSVWFIVLFRQFIYLLIFCYFFGQLLREELKSSTHCQVVYFKKKSMNFCFMYFKAPMLLHLELYLLSELALYHYEMSISISGNTSCLEVYFVINTPLPDFLGLLHLFPSFFFPFSRHFTFKVHFLTTLELTISKSSLMVSAFYVEHLAHYYLHNYGYIWVYVYHLVM